MVINLGTISALWARSARIAAEEARKRKIPIVFDPVVAGATPYRTDTFRELINFFPPTILRGNASEIMALAKKTTGTKGVDSTEASHRALVSTFQLPLAEKPRLQP